MELSKTHEKLEKEAVKKAFPSKFSKFSKEEKLEADKAAGKTGKKFTKAPLKLVSR